MYIDILILAELVARPRHGYELKQHVERIMGGSVTINANQLYPTLRRFEELGAVLREVEHQAGKPDRHVYRITDQGIETLQRLLLDFPEKLAHDGIEFKTRVAFFHLLDPQARSAILETRLRVQLRHLRHTEETRALVSETAPNYPYVTRLLAFQLQEIQNELAWIVQLKQEYTE